MIISYARMPIPNFMQSISYLHARILIQLSVTLGNPFGTWSSLIPLSLVTLSASSDPETRAACARVDLVTSVASGPASCGGFLTASLEAAGVDATSWLLVLRVLVGISGFDDSRSFLGFLFLTIESCCVDAGDLDFLLESHATSSPFRLDDVDRLSWSWSISATPGPLTCRPRPRPRPRPLPRPRPPATCSSSFSWSGYKNYLSCWSGIPWNVFNTLWGPPFFGIEVQLADLWPHYN